MSSELVQMEKAWETLLVHKTCVAAHEACGWRVSADQAAAPVQQAATPKKRKSKHQDVEE